MASKEKNVIKVTFFENAENKAKLIGNEHWLERQVTSIFRLLFKTTMKGKDPRYEPLSVQTITNALRATHRKHTEEEVLEALKHICDAEVALLKKTNEGLYVATSSFVEVLEDATELCR